jgi:hypothetical protein
MTHSPRATRRTSWAKVARSGTRSVHHHGQVDLAEGLGEHAADPLPQQRGDVGSRDAELGLLLGGEHARQHPVGGRLPHGVVAQCPGDQQAEPLALNRVLLKMP